MPLTMRNEFGGGALGRPSADFQINPANGRAISIACQTAGLDAKLPDARQFIHTGGPMFKLYNIGAHAFDVVYPNLTLLGTIPAGYSGALYLSQNSDEQGVWHLRSRAMSSADTPATPPGGSGWADPGSAGTNAGSYTGGPV